MVLKGVSWAVRKALSVMPYTIVIRKKDNGNYEVQVRVHTHRTARARSFPSCVTNPITTHRTPVPSSRNVFFSRKTNIFFSQNNKHVVKSFLIREVCSQTCVRTATYSYIETSCKNVDRTGISRLFRQYPLYPLPFLSVSTFE